MTLDHFIITTFCLVDDIMLDLLGGRRLRQRGPAPKLADSEFITIELVGEYLPLHQDKALFAYFRCHYAHFFPAFRQLHRPTFVRRAAHLCLLKERIRQPQIHFDPSLYLVDSFPLLACQFACAYRCQRFRGEGAFGYDALLHPTFYGFRVHTLVAWPGGIVRFRLAPAAGHETVVVPE